MPHAEPNPKRTVGVLLLASLVMLIVYTVFAGSTTLWDRDETRNARASVEMLYRGDWVVPHLNGELRLHKPPAINWMMAASVAMLGVNELAVRLPSILSMLGICWLTFYIARRMFDHRVGMWAFLIQASSALSIYLGSVAMLDAALVLGMTGAMAVFIDRVYGYRKWWHWPALVVALAFAMLVKGPIALLAVLSMAVIAALGRGGVVALPRRWWVGLGLCTAASLGLFLAWGVPANNATDGLYWQEGFGKHVLHRATGAMDGRGGDKLWQYLLMLPLYVPVLTGLFFPWTLHLPGAVRAMLGKRLGTRRDRAVLWGWMGTTFLAMSLVVTKLPHYILPIWPALCIACGAVIEARRATGEEQATDAPSLKPQASGLSSDDRDWLRGGIWFFLPVAVGAVGCLIAIAAAPMWTAPGLASGNLLLWYAGMLFIPGLLIYLSIVAVAGQLGERVAHVTRWLVAGAAVLLIGVSITLLPLFDSAIKPAEPIALAAREAAPGDTPIYWAGYHEASVLFYLDLPADRRVLEFEDDAHLAAWAKAGEPGVLITTDRRIDRVEQAHGKLPLRIIESFEAFNYASGAKQQRVMVVQPEASSTTQDRPEPLQ